MNTRNSGIEMKAEIKKKRKSSQNRMKELRQKNEEDINKLSASRN